MPVQDYWGASQTKINPGPEITFLYLLLLWSCRHYAIMYVMQWNVMYTVMWVRINKWSCINIQNQPKAMKISWFGRILYICGCTATCTWQLANKSHEVRLVNSWSTSIHSALLTAVDTCTHWVPSFCEGASYQLNKQIYPPVWCCLNLKCKCSAKQTNTCMVMQFAVTATGSMTHNMKYVGTMPVIWCRKHA